jgi:chromate reductase, NAD(P)H dehydrogenase (quinone)
MTQPVRILKTMKVIHHSRSSPGNIGTERAQYHLRQIFVFLNIFPINQPEVMIGNAAARFDAAGQLTDDMTKTFIRVLLHNHVDWTRQLGQRPKT